MASLFQSAASFIQSFGITKLFVGAFAAWSAFVIQRAMCNVYFHALSQFSGPKTAAATTLWKAWIECDIVRIGPNELHFAQPQAYHDIYNNKNRWNKDEILYRSFDTNHSSFGSITYAESKERKDVLNRVFSANAIEQTQGLIIEK
ncbi:hypothetical protein LTR60_006979, partial [Cryomyces antarcticus]